MRIVDDLAVQPVQFVALGRQGWLLGLVRLLGAVALEIGADRRGESIRLHAFVAGQKLVVLHDAQGRFVY